MPFRSDLLKGLREVKGLSQEQLSERAAVSQSVIAKSEKGKNLPGSDVLDRLAEALDCTIDYLHGRGCKFESVEVAAVCMAFDVAQSSLSEQQREQCRRVLHHPDAPRTASRWRAFAEMVDLAVGPTPTTRLTSMDERRSKAKPMAVATRRLN